MFTMTRPKILIFFLFLVFFACDSNTSEEPVESKIQPEGSSEITIVIDPQYEFQEYTAYTLLDSVPLKKTGEKLYAPEDFNSSVFFINPRTGDIMAQINIDPKTSAYTVNKETVSRALLGLVPNFGALTVTQQSQFGLEERTSKPYTEFAEMVDKMLVDGTPIYSTEDAFVTKLIELNQLILDVYFDGYRSGAREISNSENFSLWMTGENGTSLFNQRSSYVFVEFNALNNTEKFKTILNPEENQTLSSLGVKDNCYNVRINQSQLEAKEKNQFALATNIISMFFDQIFGVIGGGSRNDCIGAIAGSILSDITTEALNFSNSGLSSVLIAIGDIGRKAIVTSYTAESCLKYALNSAVISKALFNQLNVFSKFVSIAGNAYSLTKMTPFVISLTPLSVELNEVMQLYQGKLIPACVEGRDAGTLSESYKSGSKVFPVVKILPKSQYENWNKSGFKIEWKAISGSVNLGSSTSNSIGEATVEWTLPSNYSGDAELIAELKDKESDHLFGSPITFKTKVIHVDSLELYKEAVLGKWKTETYSLPSEVLGTTTYETVMPNGKVERTSQHDSNGIVTNYTNLYYSWYITGNDATGYFWVFAGVKSRRLSYPVNSMITELDWVRNHHTRL